MATETLRPDAAGDECNLDDEVGDICPDHYLNVDEASPDEDTTYVGTKNPWLRDLYNIENSSGSGTINHITVYARCRGLVAPEKTSLKIAIKSGTGAGAPDTVTEGNEETLTIGYANYSKQWTTNPATGSAWTWNEIDNLQAGIALRECKIFPSEKSLCTQVYVVVVYSDDTVVRVAFASDPLDDVPTWTNVSADTISFATKRGRQTQLDRMESGRFDLLLRDTNGNWWPDNAGGDYYPNVKIGKKIQISRSYNGTTYIIFTGYIHQIRPFWLGQPGKAPAVQITCYDFMRNLSKSELNNAGESQEVSGTRVGNVLDEVAFPAGDRTLDTGSYIMIATGAQSNVNALNHLYQVSESEIGLTYMLASGNLQFESRGHRASSPHDTSQATFGDDSPEMLYADIGFAMDDRLLFNEIRRTRSGGTEQSETDATSITAYGQRAHTKSGLLIINDTIADAQCALLLGRFKDNGDTMRIDFIDIFPQRDPDNLWAKVLSYEISTRITVRLNESSIDTDFFIEGIEHSSDARSGGVWKTRWWLSDATKYLATGTTVDETLRPDAAGDLTGISHQFPASTNHWDKVDEVTSDEDTTYVRHQDAGVGTDLYNLPPSDYADGTINKITVYVRVRRTSASPTVNQERIQIKTGGTQFGYELNAIASASYFNISHELTENPDTSAAWTWANIAALQIGVKLDDGAGNNARCTQVWVVVNFTPVYA